MSTEYSNVRNRCEESTVERKKERSIDTYKVDIVT